MFTAEIKNRIATSKPVEIDDDTYFIDWHNIRSIPQQMRIRSADIDYPHSITRTESVTDLSIVQEQ